MSNGVALLGAGLFATENYLPALAALGDGAPPLKAVYSRSEKSAKDLALAAADILKCPPPSVYHDGDLATNLDSLLGRSDIQAVMIVLPITLQPSIVEKALAAGKHVLSEKPVAPDVAQGSKLIDMYFSTYKDKGLVWRVAENFEAEPGIRAAAKAIRDGKIGKVIFFNAKIVNYIDKNSKWYKTPWRTVPDYQGGFLLDGGVHTIAALRVILPNPITHVSSFASLNKDYLAPHDTINAIAMSESHFHGMTEITFASPTRSCPVSDQIIVTGTDGWLSVNPTAVPNSAAYVIRTVIKSVVKLDHGAEEEKEEIIAEPLRGVKAELASFFEAVNGSDDGLGDPKGALSDVAFIQAALNSAGQLVDLGKLI